MVQSEKTKNITAEPWGCNALEEGQKKINPDSVSNLAIAV